MSNIRKTFNFRDGVQVDTEVLVVRGNQVGIGTTIPTQKVDIRGTTKVTGILSATDLYITGVSTLSNGLNVGNNVNITGVVTATSFYGDGATLSNLPTSQWVDVDVGLGFTSIYAQGHVGVGTTDPRNTFQVGGDPSAGKTGVGISSVTAMVRTSGIVSAYSFVGLGSQIGLLDARNLGIGTIPHGRFATLLNSKLPSTISVGGSITASTGFFGDLTGDVTGDVTGNADTAGGLTGTPNINVGIVTATKLIANTIEVPSTGITTISKLLHVGTSGTAFSALDSGRIGVGTAVPTSELQIRKASGSLLEVISETGQSRISLGQQTGVGKSTGILRFGSINKTFEIINNDTGSINMILHAGSSGVNTGRFDWQYGQTFDELMSLTYEGKLGIGKTNPDHELHVVGVASVTSDLKVGGDATITGTFTAGTGANQIQLGGVGGGILNNINLNNTTGVTTLSQLHVLGTQRIGIGTTAPQVGLDAATETAFLSKIGLGRTDINNTTARLYSNGDIVTNGGGIGIGTTSLNGSLVDPVTSASLDAGNLQVYGSTGLYGSLIVRNNGFIGINSSVPIGAFDMRLANLTASLRSPFYPPSLTTAERNAITPSSVAEGAVIYNSSNQRLEIRLPGGWAGISTEA